MKATRTILIAIFGVLTMAPLPHANVEIGAQLGITSRPGADFEVYVWPDRGMDGVYSPGEQINVNVELTRDAFLILYSIDTRGQMRILFPSAPWEDNFVRAGGVISFPRAQDAYNWTVDGPAGTEYIQAIASEIPISLPEWPVYLQSVNPVSNFAPELRDFRSGSDRYSFIDVVNRNITGRYYDWCATDVATFQVRPYQQYSQSYNYDPWPDVFYGEVYIGWPIGARIYVDNIYVGVAPCWVPRQYTGRRVITSYFGERLYRSSVITCFPKRAYYVNNRYHDSWAYTFRRGRNDANDHFRYERDSAKRNRYNVYDRSGSLNDDHADGGRYKSSGQRGSYDKDYGTRQKQSANTWQDYGLGKTERKSTPGRVKTADRGATYDTRSKAGSSDGNIVKKRAQSGAPEQNWSQSKSSPSRVKTADRSASYGARDKANGSIGRTQSSQPRLGKQQQPSVTTSSGRAKAAGRSSNDTQGRVKMPGNNDSRRPTQSSVGKAGRSEGRASMKSAPRMSSDRTSKRSKGGM